MTFRNKILFSIWGVVLSLLVITFFIINYWTRSRIEETLTRELRAGASTVMVHEQLQSMQLIRACAVIADSPRLRAVTELGDATTALQLLRELNQTTTSQMFVLTDRRGRLLVQLVHGKPDSWDCRGAGTIREALQSRASTDAWYIRGSVFRVVSVPIKVDAELVGSLTIGFEMLDTDIAALKRATASEFLLVHHESTILSTLDTAEARALLPAIADIQRHPFRLPEDTLGRVLTIASLPDVYLGTAYRLSQSAESDSSAVFYLILKPLSREVREAMAPILRTFGFVSSALLVLTTVVGLVVSRSMTRPIAELMNGTTEISRGNYDYAIHLRGRDELSVLARRFMEMSIALKEKIMQLGRVNDDLVERNRDLDETLRQLRRAQEELVRSERLAATGTMTAQLAHEINNPIHNIQSCLNTALNRLPDGAKGRDLIEVAYGEVSRLSRLTVQMLNLYRGSLFEEDVKPTNLVQILHEVVALTRGEFDARRISIHTDISPDLPPVRGSRDKLTQVFLNLAANARDAMPNGGRIDVVACVSDGTVRVTIRDDGVGIAPEHLPRIFDAFYTTKGKVSGVGLGLSVSYGIVHQHRGSIEVASVPGEGSAFTVVLPYERIE